MKTGLTIKEMAQELLRQSKAKQDYLVNTGSLSLSVTTDAPQLRVTENGLDKIGAPGYSPDGAPPAWNLHSHGLCGWAGI